MPRIGHQKQGFDFRIEALIHTDHLEFIFEVGDGPKPSDNHGGADLLCELDQQ